MEGAPEPSAAVTAAPAAGIGVDAPRYTPLGPANSRSDPAQHRHPLMQDPRDLHGLGSQPLHPSSLAERCSALKRRYSALLQDSAAVSQELQRSYRRVAELRYSHKLLVEHLEALNQARERQKDSLASDGYPFNVDPRGAWSPPRRRKRTQEGDPSRNAKSGDHAGQGEDLSDGMPHGQLLDTSVLDEHRRHPRDALAGSGRTERDEAPSARKKRKNLGAPRKVHDYPRDDSGRAVLPMRIGALDIHNLGRIDIPFKDNFHNERYIYPVGFESSRQYMSMVDPNRTTTYVSSVGEEKGEPKFMVRAEDQPGQVFQSKTPTGAWTPIVRGANAVRNREHSNSANGPDLFGFSLPLVALMIQDLPGADRCRNYLWQKFDVIPQAGQSGQPSGSESGAATASSGILESGNILKHEELETKPGHGLAPERLSFADAGAATPAPALTGRCKSSGAKSRKASDRPSSSKKAKKKAPKKDGKMHDESPQVRQPGEMAISPPLPDFVDHLFRGSAPAGLPALGKQSSDVSSHPAQAAGSVHQPLDQLTGRSANQPGPSAAYGVEDADMTEDEEV